jgi:cytochrome c peroxidase
MTARVATLSLVGSLCACGGAEPAPAVEEPADAAYELELPPGFPKPYVPIDNLLTVAKVELGRRLFYDRRLSVNGSQSCASCHVQALAFTDGQARPAGATGELAPRSSMSLVNVAYFYPYTWANPKPHTLEQQVLIPLFGEAPLELGLTGVIDDVIAALRAEPVYQRLFPRAFPELAEPFVSDAIVKALASFERTLISGGSPFDRYAYGEEEDAISADAKRGFELFNTERFECYHCHAGLNFTTAFRAASSPFLGKDYQNNGLYDVDGEGSYPLASPGLVEISGNPADRGKFRVPTLRNVAFTAPYMHDGSIATLDDVLEHYAAGGRLLEDGPDRGDGRLNPNKSQFVRGFRFEADEKRQLLALLHSLSDDALLTDPRFADPWRTP